MKKRIKKPLLVIILAFLLAAGCAPVEIEQPVPAAEIGSISATVTEVAALAPSSTAPPVPTKTPYPTTPTPDPALPPWTREPSPTPTIQPTFTPIPGAVWPILFAGNPCPPREGSIYCQEQWPESGQWYQINSDGSELRRVPQLDNPEPEDYYGRNIQILRFSPDKQKIAYAAGNHIYLSNPSNDEPLVLLDLPANYWATLSGFDLVAESDCLIVYWRANQQSQKSERLTIFQVCSDQSDWKMLSEIEIPDLMAGTASTSLSHQGDAVLIRGQDNDGKNRLYVYEMSSDPNLRLLFVEPDLDDGMIFLGPFRWQFNSWYVEYISNNYQYEGSLIVTYHLIDREGKTIETRILATSSINLFLSYDHDWSPDGLEVVFAKNNDLPEFSGIFISNLESGTIRQILPEFHISRGPFWSPEFP